MNLLFKSYNFNITSGISIDSNKHILYRNDNPVSITVKTKSTACEFYYGSYSSCKETPDGFIAKGIINTPHGSSFEFQDLYQITESGIKLTRKVSVLSAGSEYGFSSRFSLFFTDINQMKDLDCFAPGCFYKTREYMLDHNIGKDTDAEYAWIKETRIALPVFSAYDSNTGEALSLSRWTSDIQLRDLSRCTSENTVDGKCSFGSIGLSNATSQGLSSGLYQ